MADRTVTVKIDGDTRGLQAALRGANSSMSTSTSSASKFGGMLSGALKAGAIGAAVAVAAVGAAAIKFGISAVSAAADAERVMDSTKAVIKSTGGAANVTAGHVKKMADSLSHATGIENDLIQEGANMLLTFTNIRNEVGKGNDMFDQSTEILVDLSTMMGTDAKTSAIQLGKALNDPVKGVSALSEVGVTFTEQTKKQITQLVKQGDVMGAQKIILKELNKEFGGQAKAQADAMGKVKNSISIVMEKLGKGLLPAVKRAAKVIEKFAKSKEFKAWMKDAKKWLEKASDAVMNFFGFVGDKGGTLDSAGREVKGFQGKLQSTTDTVETTSEKFKEFMETTETVFNAVKMVVGLFWGALRQAFDPAIRLVQFAIDLWDRFGPAVRNAIDSAKDAISSFNPANLIPDWMPGDQGRAAGGPVMAGVPYLVGERGPELIVPRSAGTVIPNHRLRGGGGGGGTTIIINADPSDKAAIRQMVSQALNENDRRTGRMSRARFK